MEKGDLVYIKTTNNMGYIINTGNDGVDWYRTDMDGIRDKNELVKIQSIGHLLDLIKQEHGVGIAPSVKKKLCSIKLN